MSNLDLIIADIAEALEEIAADEPNEQLQEVLDAYNTDIYGVGHKLKMIAWDRQ